MKFWGDVVYRWPVIVPHIPVIEKNVSENLTWYSTKNNGIFLFLIVLYFFLDEEEGELTYIQG